MKADQVAFYCVDENAVNELKVDLRLDKSSWVTDTVTGQSKVVKNNDVINGINVAELQFNYALGIELEIIRYISGPHWHPDLSNRRFISHVGIHLDDGEAFPLMPHSRIVQETHTISHTSEYLTSGPGAGRKYHYRIHELSFGNYIKFIRRIHPEAT